MILLLGSKEEVPQKPKEQVKFIEDMDEDEMATAVTKHTPPLYFSLNHTSIRHKFTLEIVVAGITGRS